MKNFSDFIRQSRQTNLNEASNQFNVHKTSKKSDVDFVIKDYEKQGMVFDEKDFVFVKKIKNDVYVIGYDQNEGSYFETWLSNSMPFNDNLSVNEVKDRILIAS